MRVWVMAAAVLLAAPAWAQPVTDGKAAMESVFVKAKADGREPPAPYLHGGTFHNVGRAQVRAVMLR